MLLKVTANACAVPIQYGLRSRSVKVGLLSQYVSSLDHLSILSNLQMDDVPSRFQ